MIPLHDETIGGTSGRLIWSVLRYITTTCWIFMSVCSMSKSLLQQMVHKFWSTNIDEVIFPVDVRFVPSLMSRVTFDFVMHAYLKKKNILSLKITNKGKISIFLFVEKGFYEHIIGEIIAHDQGNQIRPILSWATSHTRQVSQTRSWDSLSTPPVWGGEAHVTGPGTPTCVDREVFSSNKFFSITTSSSIPITTSFALLSFFTLLSFSSDLLWKTLRKVLVRWPEQDR